MKRRNPATASSPNPQFELTSFMDVIFIFLFVVMIGYAFKCAEEKDNANSKMTEAEQLLAEADRRVAEAEQKLEEAESHALQSFAESFSRKPVSLRLCAIKTSFVSRTMALRTTGSHGWRWIS